MYGYCFVWGILIVMLCLIFFLCIMKVCLDMYDLCEMYVICMFWFLFLFLDVGFLNVCKDFFCLYFSFGVEVYMCWISWSWKLWLMVWECVCWFC